MARTWTEDQYVLDQAGEIPHAVFAGGQARAMSDAALRRAQKEHERELREWHSNATAARKKYRRLVSEGKLRPPTRIERLLETARGHSDNQSVQAARRILKKRGISWGKGLVGGGMAKKRRARPRKARQRAPRDVQKVADDIYGAQRALNRTNVARDDPAAAHVAAIEKHLIGADRALTRLLKTKSWGIR